MLTGETLDAFLADVNPYLERTPFGDEGFVGSRTQRCSALMAKSLHSGDMLTQAQFLGAAEKLLPRPYDFVLGSKAATIFPTVQLSVTQLVQLWPGQGAQPLHRDDGLHHRRHPGPESQLQVLYAATDFTEANGATLVVPKSHLWDDDRRPTMEEAVPAIMKRGSGLIYFGSLYHGGGINRTLDEKRTAIIFSVTIGYLRQEENQYLVVPIEIVRKYPKRVQELLGYAISPPFCGSVEMQSPSIVLDSADFSTAAAGNLI
jgi:ectoine hydroxylase-related dioxygenase (phytanoyl-CoA dioxygenase family)